MAQKMRFSQHQAPDGGLSTVAPTTTEPLSSAGVPAAT